MDEKKEEMIAEIWAWAHSSKGLENLWGDGLEEEIRHYVYKENRSVEWIKKELKTLDKMEF